MHSLSMKRRPVLSSTGFDTTVRKIVEVLDRFEDAALFTRRDSPSTAFIVLFVALGRIDGVCDIADDFHEFRLGFHHLFDSVD